MTSVIKQAFNNVKHLFFRNRDSDNTRNENLPAAPAFSLGDFKLRSGPKRYHDHFEAELTEDDDDDLINTAASKSKRMKTDNDISIIYYQRGAPNPINFGKPSMDMENQHLYERGGNLNILQRSSNANEQHGKKESSGLAFARFGSIIGARGKSENFDKKSQSTSTVASSTKQSSTELSSFAPNSREEMYLRKINHSKIKKHKFSGWFSQFGKKSDFQNTVRLDEKLRYKQLLEKVIGETKSSSPQKRLLDKVTPVSYRLSHTSSFRTSHTSKFESHLKLSRDELPLVESVYKKWDSCTSPSSVTKRADLIFPSTSSLKSHVSPVNASPVQAKKGIQLFSLSGERGKLSPAFQNVASPIMINLDKENVGIDITPNVKTGGSKVDNPVGTPVYASTPSERLYMRPTSFSDLDEALEASGSNPLKELSKDQSIRSTGSNEDEVEEISLSRVDDDLIILSESIVRKGRERRINSLALEQTSSPYAQRSWLTESSSDWKEKQKLRKSQIEVEKETLDVLRKESTLDESLRDAIRKKLTLTEIIELEEQPLTLPEIDDDMKAVIISATRPGRDSDVLGTVFNVDITRGDVRTLAPCKWLNDNVINVYMELIAARSKEGKYPKCHVFSTFFYPKYLKEGYSNPLKRWTRKVDVFAHDLVIFPIHLGMHWCLAVADLRDKTIKYYDSLGGRNDKCLRALLDYLSHELKERKNQVLETHDWKLENVDGIPEQQNGSDCGMFTCKFAECLSREAKLDFIKQENMNYYRERMIYELLKKDLLFP